MAPGLENTKDGLRDSREVGPGIVKPDASATDARRTDRARVLVLGANAWVVLAVLPSLLAEPRSPGHVLWLLLPLPPLAVGALLLSRSQVLAGWALLGGYPTLLAAAVAILPRLVVQSPYSTVGLVLGALSVVAYGAGTVFAVTRPYALRATTRRPLGSVAAIDEPGSRIWARRALLALATTGAVVLAVVVPALGGTASYEEAWGRAAPEAAVLTAVAGGALGTAVLALFIGPSLRAPRTPDPTRRQVRRRVTALLVSVAIGVAFWVFYLARA